MRGSPTASSNSSTITRAVGRDRADLAELPDDVVDCDDDRVAVERALAPEEAHAARRSRPGRSSARRRASASTLVAVSCRSGRAPRASPTASATRRRNGADALAQVVRPPGVVAAPERHARHLARRRLGDDAVVGDLERAPDLRAEQEGVALARLEDELLVQLADLGAPVGQHQRVGAAVGDRAAALDRQAARAGQGGQPVVHAVPGDAAAWSWRETRSRDTCRPASRRTPRKAPGPRLR